MHSNNITTPREQIKNSFKSLRTAASKISNKVSYEIEDLSKSLKKDCENIKEDVTNLNATLQKQAKNFFKNKAQDTEKNLTKVGAEKKYEVEDLPKFFKDKSKEIGKVFSNEVIEISTICSKNITSDTQEFSFKIKLLTEVNRNTISPQIKHLIDFFKICLSQEKNFTTNIKVAKESKELYNNYYKTDKTVEKFISNAPIQILLQGITITLQTDVKNINLGSLQQIEAFLNEQLKHVKKAKSEEQSQDTLQAEKTESKDKKIKSAVQQKNKQIVQVKDSFGYNIASNRKQITRVPVIVAAMHENFSWFGSLLQPFNFFNATQFFFPQLPKFSIQSNNMPSGVITALDQKGKEPVSETRITEGSIGNLVPQEIERDIGQTRSHTDYFKANRKKKSKKQAKKLSEEEKQSIIKQAQIDARVAMVNNERKTLDEIFVEVVSEYKNQDSDTFCNIFNSVFNIVYFQDKQLHEVLESDEISEALEMLEIPQPAGKSFILKEYLQKQVDRKKVQLLKLVSGIPIQPSPQLRKISHEILPSKVVDSLLKINKPTDITLKSPLKTVFSSKETYFCLFLVAASISALCLWNLPMGKVSVLKELVPIEKRESIGLVLNIGLPILITLCVLSLAYFIYSKYSVESIEQISKKDLLSCT